MRHGIFLDWQPEKLGLNVTWRQSVQPLGQGLAAVPKMAPPSGTERPELRDLHEDRQQSTEYYLVAR